MCDDKIRFVYVYVRACDGRIAGSRRAYRIPIVVLMCRITIADRTISDSATHMGLRCEAVSPHVSFSEFKMAELSARAASRLFFFHRLIDLDTAPVLFRFPSLTEIRDRNGMNAIADVAI